MAVPTVPAAPVPIEHTPRTTVMGRISIPLPSWRVRPQMRERRLTLALTTPITQRR
jgi:hypothetical protein